MAFPQVDGVQPQRAGTTQSSSTTGSTPRAGASDAARSDAFAKQFAQQVELSMLKTTSSLGVSDDSGDESSDESSTGSDDLGLGSIGQLDLAVTLLQASRGATGQAAALIQSQVATLMGGGSDALASLGQSMLASASSAPTATSATPATPAVESADARTNARIVAQVAKQQGVDPVAAVATMLVESGGRNTAVGDGGTSFGLFQLHEGGMLTAAGLTAEQAFDARTNATVALRSLAHEFAKGHATRTPGEIAAASQRPADPIGYARKVDAAMDRARALLAGA